MLSSPLFEHSKEQATTEMPKTIDFDA